MSKLALLLSASLVVSCKKASDPPAPPAQAGSGSAAPVAPVVARPASTGWYRAVLGEKQGTPIPFFVQITGDKAVIATGPDRIPATLVAGPPSVVLAFDIYRTSIKAAAQPGGALDGSWDSTSGSWGAASLSFHAEPVVGPEPALRFGGTAAAGPDPVGVWKIALRDQADPAQPGQAAKLVISKSPSGELLGNLSFQTGNLAFLAGAQDGRTIKLSAFDGASPYLFVGELDEAGTALTGTWTAGQGLTWKDTATGQRTEDFTLELQTKVSGARPRLGIPQLAKAPYKGSPVIVEIGGSWCPACGNAVAKLRDLQRTHGPAGLQLLTLAYEFTDDPAYNQAQAAAFKAKYGIPWEVVPVDGGLERYGDIIPKGLERIDPSGFPITVFVRRDGTIEGFHSSFPADTWGDVYKHTVAEYDRLTAAILAPGR